MIVFEAFPKIPRLFRECTITEKLNGTNAQIIITEEGEIGAASRNRLLSPTDDNYGFFKWVYIHQDQLLALGPGRHFGEWYGAGIQCGYGLKEKRFALFNTHRWNSSNIPDCCEVVPVLYTGMFSTEAINNTTEHLRNSGSVAVPGWMKPEGVIVYHHTLQSYSKVLLDNDHLAKSQKDS